MRSFSIPSSLIFVASAALSFGACGEPAATPGGSGMTTNPTGPAAGGTPTSTNAGTPGGTTPMAGTTGMTATGTSGAGAKPGGTAGGTATAAGGSPATAGGAGATASAAGSGAAAAGSSAGAAGGAAAGGAATFTRVHTEILTGTGCSVGACHGSAMAASRLGLADKAATYKELVGIKAMGSKGPAMMNMGGCAGMPIDRVKAGDPAMSLLVQKLEGKQTCGDQMPPGGMLKAEQIQLVKDWIMAGAKDD